MNQSNKFLSDIASYSRYAKTLVALNRKESFEETINRNMHMHLDRFPKLSKDIIRAYTLVHEYKILPSMRGLQFGGDLILKNNIRQNNCSALPIEDPRCFGEVLFLLLSGTGVGYSVQKEHIKNLPKITQPRQEGTFLIQDSIYGWAQALDALVDSYFYCRVRPIFNYSNISPKGTSLSNGAKAPGPTNLKRSLELIEGYFKMAIGRQLKDIEINDILCIVADCVVAGGIRRSSSICIFDANSEDMLKAKSGDWWVKYPWRARANNTAKLLRDKLTREEFDFVFNKARDSKAGEPGIELSNSINSLLNPCAEASVFYNFCNLTTINQTTIEDKKDFMSRVRAAALIGTLQASYTDFPYIRPIWKERTEAEALLGVSFTGIADAQNKISAEWLQEGARLVLETNEKYAKKIGINLAARTTLTKPEGSSSCVLGSSSGVHARHSKYYLRRMRFNKDEPIANYLINIVPDLVEDDLSAKNTIVLTIPQESPEGSICRVDESAIDVFNRVSLYYNNWILPGHRSGIDTHNVSCTINVKDHEWDELKEVMWNNNTSYRSISLFPYDGGSYKQAPFEECTKEIFEKYNERIKEINLQEIREDEDNEDDLLENSGCVGGMCELR